MKRQQASRVRLKARQRGAATMTLVSVLLLVMSLATLTTARVGINEIYISGNDMRAREAKEVAEAGLEFAIAWAGKNTIPWPVDDILTCLASTVVAGCPGLPTVTDSSSGENYVISSLTFERADAASSFIQVTAVATGSDDSTITAMAQSILKQSGLLSQEAIEAPPLVLDGCMSNNTGQPDIFPGWTDLDGDGFRDAGELLDTALITSAPLSCLDLGHLDENGGGIESDFAIGDLWDYFFDVSQATFQSVAASTLDTAGGAYWLTGATESTFNNTTYGSVTDPVIIIIADGCSKLQGTINGIVFYLEQEACGSGGTMNGLGNVTVNGSVVVNGAINKITANSAFNNVSSDGSGNALINIPTRADRLPGTWKDF